MPEADGKTYRATAARRKEIRGRYSAMDTAGAGEAPKKKNLRLHQSKINEAKAILGTSTETETIEAALDLVVFRKEMVDGVRAMRRANLVNVFDDVE